MLDSILQSLREVAGVQGAMVVDQAATLVAHHAHAIYDASMLQQVARSVGTTVDSVQLIQDDWEVLTAHFGEGRLVLRSVKTTGAKPRRLVLVVIGDATLNVAFLGVALRVAAAKLASAFDAVPAPVAASSSAPAPVAVPAATSSRIPLPEQPRVELARTGVGWSGSGSLSTVDGSGVDAADAASSAFLSACSRALTTSLGPIAKVFVRDAVRKLCNGRPFSRADGPTLIAQLAAMIDNPQDRATFQRATRGL
jgi:predicted regulator of Ras-like GTPase activity (Roadblock/LC7/MglB family)